MTRRHRITSVYVHDAAGLELVLLGQVKMGLKNGVELESPFACQLIVTCEAEEPRIGYMQVYAASTSFDLMSFLRDIWANVVCSGAGYLSSRSCAQTIFVVGYATTYI
jgi:hypothetical protein